MASIDAVSITILFGAVLVLAGIMSSLVALRFGAPLLLVFLLVGMLAGESGIGGIKFDDVRLAYTVGSVALGLILFDGGLRTRLATFRNVLAPAGMLATVGVLITMALTAPVAVWALQLNWSEGLLVGAVMASTDAAAVFFLLHAKGLRLRPARFRDARGRVRHQRSVRDLSHHRPGRDPAVRQQAMDRHRRLAGRESHHRRLPRLGRRPRHRPGAQPPGAAAGDACAVRRHRRAGDVRPGRVVARLRLPRGLYRRADRRQSRDARPQHHRDIPRCRDLAGADRHVRAARPAGLARPAAAAPAAGARRGIGADADRAAGRGAGLPCAVPLQLPGKAVHLVGRPARRGVGVSRLDPDAGRLARRAFLFRRRLRRGHAVACDPGLDHRASPGSCCASACRASTSARAAPSSICPAR